MLYSQWLDLVYDNISVEANRRGLEKFRQRHIFNGMVNLQRYIVAYRTGHKTIYTQSAMEEMGAAQMADIPVNARPTAIYHYSEDKSDLTPRTPTPSVEDGGFLTPDFDEADFTTVDAAEGADYDPADFDPADFSTAGGSVTTVHPFYPDLAEARLKRRNRLDYTSWMDRQKMINGQRGCRDYVYAISPHGRKFMVFPRITDEMSTRIVLFWDGIKESWQPGDVLNWPEATAEAVASYYMMKVERLVNKNIALSREYERDWVGLRLALYREAREKLDAEKPEEESILTTQAVPPPT